MTIEIDTDAVETVGTETFPAVAGVFGEGAAKVEAAQQDAALAMFNSGFLATWVDYNTQLYLYVKQSKANLEVCGEMLTAMAREIAGTDEGNRDEIEATYVEEINNPDTGSYREAAEL